jgi:DNA-binding MarR family transcriptional regulator
MDYVILSDLAHRSGPAGYRELARDVGYSKKSVFHSVQKLIGRGLVNQTMHNGRALYRSIVISSEGRTAFEHMNYLYEIVDQTQVY